MLVTKSNITNSGRILVQNQADWWLLFCICAYFLMNGAQLWETILFIPSWTAAPPASLTLLQGKMGMGLKNFWITLHAIHEVIFLIAIYFNWRIKPRRNALLLILAAHMAVRAWTVLYFASVIIEFQQMLPSHTVNPDLQEKAAQWKNLNYLRVGIFFLLNLFLLPLLNLKSKCDGAR